MLIPHAGEASAVSCSKQTKADPSPAPGIGVTRRGGSGSFISLLEFPQFNLIVHNSQFIIQNVV